jgi:hypothetical protein
LDLDADEVFARAGKIPPDLVEWLLAGDPPGVRIRMLREMKDNEVSREQG